MGPPEPCNLTPTTLHSPRSIYQNSANLDPMASDGQIMAREHLVLLPCLQKYNSVILFTPFSLPQLFSLLYASLIFRTQL